MREPESQRDTHAHTHADSTHERASVREHTGERATERAGGRTREREFHIKTLRYYYDYDAGATRIVGCQGAGAGVEMDDGL